MRLSRPLCATGYEALLGLLAVSGMRVGEAVSLERKDVDLDARMLLVAGEPDPPAQRRRAGRALRRQPDRSVKRQDDTSSPQPREAVRRSVCEAEVVGWVSVGESVSEVDLEGCERARPATHGPPLRFGAVDGEVDELGRGLFVGEVSAGLARGKHEHCPDLQRVGRLPNVAHWVNVFDYNDVLGFAASKIFDGVEDFAYSTGKGVAKAHGSYFVMPSFYRRLADHIRG
jgi:hypothetical protein